MEQIAEELVKTNVHSLNFRYRPDQVEFLLDDYTKDEAVIVARRVAKDSGITLKHSFHLPKGEVRLFDLISDYDYQSCEDYKTYKTSKVKEWLNNVTRVLAGKLADRIRDKEVQ